MRRRQLKALWKRLQQLQNQKLTRDELLLKLGAAKGQSPSLGDWSTFNCPPNPNPRN